MKYFDIETFNHGGYGNRDAYEYEEHDEHKAHAHTKYYDDYAPYSTPSNHEPYTEQHEEKSAEHLLARSFVLYQKFERLYTPLECLKRGTAFKDLDKPYHHAKS